MGPALGMASLLLFTGMTFIVFAMTSAEMNSSQHLRGERHLDEVPVQGHGVSATEQDALVYDENVTLDAMAMATLSSAAVTCHASTTLLRNCGARCFGKPAGNKRAECISECLHATIQEDSCASCYGRRSDCTIEHCIRPCSRSAYGTPCKTCVHSKCGGDCR